MVCPTLRIYHCSYGNSVVKCSGTRILDIYPHVDLLLITLVILYEHTLRLDRITQRIYDISLGQGYRTEAVLGEENFGAFWTNTFVKRGKGQDLGKPLGLASKALIIYLLHILRTCIIVFSRLRISCEIINPLCQNEDINIRGWVKQ
jgi:hypothetical protein